MNYLGDYILGDQVTFKWSTFTKDGQSVTLTSGDIVVYKGDDPNDSTSSGVSVSTNFDSLTGVHQILIDTGDSGGFYESGLDYAVVLDDGVIDGNSVNATLANFSIENRTPSISNLIETLLKFDLSTISDESVRSPINALRKLVNRVAVDTGTLTIYKEDDSTAAFTQTVATDVSAEPIISLDTD